jgi:hypothetical protein
MTSEHPTMQRLEQQIAWYDGRSRTSQRDYKALKVVTLAAAAFIPFSAGFDLTPWLTGSLGVVIALTEGLQQLNQYHHNWITYRSTAEYLKHEKYLYLATSGPYRDQDDANIVLAERVESLTSQEHAKWVASQYEVRHEARRSS